MIKMKVGNYYFSKKAGVLQCVSEKSGKFFVANKDYGYHVTFNGEGSRSFYEYDILYECYENGEPVESFSLSADEFCNQLKDFSKNLNDLSEAIKNSEDKNNFPPKISKETQINQLLSGFDFDKVHKVMKNLGWTWHDSVEEDGVPNHAELVIAAQRYLSDVYDSMGYCSENSASSRGFCVHAKKYDDGEILLELKFVVESMNWSSENLVY